MPRTGRSLSLLAACAVIAGIASPLFGQPTVAREQIPRDAPKKVRKKIEAMYSENARKRLDAVVDLIKLGPEAAPAVPFLVGILGDSEDVEMTFSRSAGSMTVTMTAVGRPGQSAVKALAAIGAAAVEPTLAALGHEKAEVRARAAEALGEIKDRRALAGLVARLKDENEEVRKAVVAALELITGEKHGEDATKWEALVQG